MNVVTDFTKTVFTVDQGGAQISPKKSVISFKVLGAIRVTRNRWDDSDQAKTCEIRL